MNFMMVFINSIMSVVDNFMEILLNYRLFLVIWPHNNIVLLSYKHWGFFHHVLSSLVSSVVFGFHCRDFASLVKFIPKYLIF